MSKSFPSTALVSEPGGCTTGLTSVSVGNGGIKSACTFTPVSSAPRVRTGNGVREGRVLSISTTET